MFHARLENVTLTGCLPACLDADTLCVYMYFVSSMFIHCSLVRCVCLLFV